MNKNNCKLISRLNNLNNKKKNFLITSFNKTNKKIIFFLIKNGFISNFKIIKNNKQTNKIIIILKNNKPFKKIKIISHGSLNTYMKYKDLKNYKINISILTIVSTNRGLLYINEAIRKKIGGKLLFSIYV